MVFQVLSYPATISVNNYIIICHHAYTIILNNFAMHTYITQELKLSKLVCIYFRKEKENVRSIYSCFIKQTRKVISGETHDGS